MVALLTLLLFTANPDDALNVPEDVVGVIESAEASLRAKKPREALGALERYEGPGHAYLDLFEGHARFDLEDYAGALSAYSRALNKAPELEPARLGQARTLAAEGQWREVVRLLGPWVDINRSSPAALHLLGRAALESGDLRRASLIAERGLLRFADELSFRRLDAAVLLERRDWRKASEAARSVLAETPDDALAWKQLAASERERESLPEYRAALEAAHLANPADDAAFHRHAQAQFEAGHLPEALRLTRVALERPALTENPAFVELAVRIAEAADAYDLGNRWISLVPPAERNRALTLIEARMALASHDGETARAALDRLIERGEASANVLVRAGKLAEEDGKDARAESLYAQAAAMEGPGAGYARLAQARLQLRTGQRPRAIEALERYLAEHPDDLYARQLLRYAAASKN